jgi:hypothetical protein
MYEVRLKGLFELCYLSPEPEELVQVVLTKNIPKMKPENWDALELCFVSHTMLSVGSQDNDVIISLLEFRQQFRA